MPPSTPGDQPAEALAFLSLLGKDPAHTRLRALKPARDANGTVIKGKKADRRKLPFDLAEAARLNADGWDIYLVSGDGGDTAAEIRLCRALFCEWDDKPLDWQAIAWQELGLPEPTVQIATGGKSIHNWWVLRDPLPPDQWRALQARLIAYAQSDPCTKDPCRLMRLPGFTHQQTGNRSGILTQSGQRYSAWEIEDCLPEEPAATPLLNTPSSAAEWRAEPEARPMSDILEALPFYPRRVAGNNNYASELGDRDFLWGLRAAVLDAGGSIEYAIALGEQHSPSKLCGWDVEQVIRSANGSKKADTFWRIVRDHGWKPANERQRTPAATATPKQGQDAAQPSRSPDQPLPYTDLLRLTLAAVRSGDQDAEMPLRAELTTRFRRSNSQIDAALFRLLAEDEAGAKPSAAPCQSVDLDAITGMDPLIDGFLPDNDIGLIYGAKGSGKTLAALAMAFAVIDGRGFLDHERPAEAGAVLFIASDSGAMPLKAAMQDLGVADHPAVRTGAEQRFYVWAYEPGQHLTAWDASIGGCLRLLDFVKANGIRLVVIDSAKAVSAKAGWSYLDNDTVTAFLTFLKETVARYATVLVVSHDGTSPGSHSGAKAWAEVPSVVHRIQSVDNPNQRRWCVVKNRMGSIREFSYEIDDSGDISVALGDEVIGDAEEAVVRVLADALLRGEETLSRSELVQEIGLRFGKAGKTVDNTLCRLVRARSPRVCRVNTPRGHYKLSPREQFALSNSSLHTSSPIYGKEEGKKPVRDSDLPSSHGVGSGNSDGNSSSRPVPVGTPVGTRQTAPNASQGQDSADVPSRDRETPPARAHEDLPDVGSRVQLFHPRTGWANGYVLTSLPDADGLVIISNTATGSSQHVRPRNIRPCEPT